MFSRFYKQNRKNFCSRQNKRKVLLYLFDPMLMVGMRKYFLPLSIFIPVVMSLREKLQRKKNCSLRYKKKGQTFLRWILRFKTSRNSHECNHNVPYQSNFKNSVRLCTPMECVLPTSTLVRRFWPTERATKFQQACIHISSEKIRQIKINC